MVEDGMIYHSLAAEELLQKTSCQALRPSHNMPEAL